MDIKKQFKRIGTHDGRFHADEVMATAVIREIFEVELVRTRDEKILNKLDIVYDVGGGEFDHHGVDKIYRDDGIPFAACGLIWNKFGRDLFQTKYPSLDEDEVESVFKYMDRNLMEGIDAMDNGIRIADGEIPIMNISSIVSGYNPAWNSDKDEDEAFNEALDVVSVILRNTINKRISVVKSKNIVVEAYRKRAIPQILVLDSYCPYGEALKDIDENGEVLFVVYPRKDDYTIQTVRGIRGEDKKKLPRSWAGKRDEELSNVTGVPDAVFCHTGRFIAVAGSFDGIMKMAWIAINEQEDERGKRGIIEFFRRFFNRK